MSFSYNFLGSNGRLGNQLFQIAGTIGRAHKAGDLTKAYFPKWKYSDYFSVPPDHFEVSSGPSTSLGREYLQDLSEFSGCEDYIREVFQPSELATSELNATYSDLLVGHRTAVHIRRGDYVANLGSHPPCPVHYFRKAMELVQEKYSQTIFLVFSDDIDWCRTQFEETDQLKFVTRKMDRSSLSQDVIEFNLMRTCDAHVISNSTFSWWAAYLASSSLVIAPTIWYGNELKHIDVEVMIPDSWERVSSENLGPIQNPALEVSEAEDGLVILNVRNRRVHHLNSTASLLFELCNGENTLSEIIELMDRFSTNLQVIDFDAKDTLDMFTREGLISY